MPSCMNDREDMDSKLGHRHPEVAPGVVRGFVTTQWSLVLAAGQAQAPMHQEALDTLCRTYWYPVYAFIRRRGHGPTDAEDLAQEFFARLLVKEWLAGIEPNGSRFRAFLVTAVARFLANEHDRQVAQKRGGGRQLLPLEDAEERFLSRDDAGLGSERAFDRHWALTVMDTGLKRLRDEAYKSGRETAYGHLAPLLSREPAAGEYDAIGRELAMEPGAISVAVFRLRRRYREVVREIVTETVADAGDVDAEVQYLIEVLSRTEPSDRRP